MTRPAVGYSGFSFVLGIAVLVWLAPARPGGAVRQDPPDPSAQDPQRPIFRTDVDFVRVDVYPRQRGRVIEDMAKREFQVFEDGRPQTIETFEYISLSHGPEVEELDPRNAREALRMAADPQTRVFAIFLDTYHVTFEGSARARGPLLEFLRSGLGPRDLFGVMTPQQSPELFELGRGTQNAAALMTLSRPWALYDELEPDEYEIEACQPNMSGEPGPGPLVRRWRLHEVLTALEGLIVHLAAIRPERKNLIVISDTWSPARRSRPGVTSPRAGPRLDSGLPGGMSGQGGRGSFQLPRGVTDPGRRCGAIINYLRGMSMTLRMRELPDLAIKANVALYMVPPAPGSLFNDPTSWFRAWAEETDGLSVISNDLSVAFKRVIDHQTGFYMLGYRSDQGSTGRRVRRIEVKATRRGVDLQVRREYLPPSPEQIAAREGNLAPVERTDVERALDSLERLRDTTGLFVRAVTDFTGTTVTAELGSADAARAPGVEVEVVVRDEAGEAGQDSGTIESGGRGAQVVIDPSADRVPTRAAVRVLGARELSEFVDVVSVPGPLLGGARLFRAGPLPAQPFHPAAEPRFDRTERLRIEWPVKAALTTRGVRLLNAQGEERAADVTLTELDGVPRMLRADIRLLSLAAADYVIEATAEGGGTRDRQLLAIRVER